MLVQIKVKYAEGNRRAIHFKGSVCQQCKTVKLVTVRNFRKRKFCSTTCSYKSYIKQENLIKPATKECKNCSNLVSRAYYNRYCSNTCRHEANPKVGNNNPNWKGGIETENHKQRNSEEYKKWRIAVFERDNYTCVWCSQYGGVLNADHVKPFALFPELRLDINNGRTLCERCHDKRQKRFKDIDSYVKYQKLEVTLYV